MAHPIPKIYKVPSPSWGVSSLLCSLDAYLSNLINDVLPGIFSFQTVSKLLIIRGLIPDNFTHQVPWIHIQEVRLLTGTTFQKESCSVKLFKIKECFPQSISIKVFHKLWIKIISFWKMFRRWEGWNWKG